MMTFLLLLLLMGCGSNGPERLRIGLEAERGSNLDAPVAVAVLVVYNDEIFRELSRLKASEWFEQSQQRQRDNPEMADFDLLSWELMPGQKVKEMDIELQGRPAQGLVFADYNTDGHHRERFNPGRRLLVLLGINAFSVVTLEEDD